MNYKTPVKFTSTDNYGGGPPNEDDVYTVQEFLDHVRAGSFIDYDGFGYPVKDGLADESCPIHPSECPGSIPSDATHIVWYNR